MARPRRRLVAGVLIVLGLVLSAATVRVGLKWQQALDTVGAMRVAPVTLPTQPPQAQATLESADGTQIPQAEQAPTAEAPAEPTPIPGPDAPMNILLLGTDARIGEAISRTDA